MEKQDNAENLCISVFKDGKKTTSKEAYTRKWIELISRMEKDREHAVSRN